MKPEDFEVTDDTERRTHTVEMRVKDASYGKKTPTLEGYGANFNTLSENLGGFREMLMPGCFKEAIATSDVRALINHDANLITGRTASGTLRLIEDEKGLRFENDPPETTYANDLQISMKRGDINQCSFGFTVDEDGQSWAKDTDGLWIRTITKIKRLFDVSFVTYPAYVQTSCAVRSLVKKQNELELEEKRKLEEQAEAERQHAVYIKRKRLELAERNAAIVV